MVGRERADDHARLAALQDGRRQADGRGRVAGLALEDDVLIGQLGQLRLDGGAVGATRDDHDALLARQRRQAIPGVAQQRLPRTGEVVQELGRVGARQRPEPGADAAGGDHAVEAFEGSLSHPFRIVAGPRMDAAANEARSRRG